MQASVSDVLAKLPEGLIQELIHMMEEGLPGEPGSGNLRIWFFVGGAGWHLFGSTPKAGNPQLVGEDSKI